MPELTPERLREIEARCEAATKGPWESPLKDLGKVESFKAVDFYFDHSFEAYPPTGESGPVFVANSKENAEFLFHARSDIPDLLAALKQLRTQLLRASLTIAAYHESYGIGLGDLKVVELAEALGFDGANGHCYEAAKRWLDEQAAHEGTK